MTTSAELPRLSLRDTMWVVHQLLRGEISAAEASEQLGNDESRLAIYHRFVSGHVRNVLEKNFAVLVSLFPKQVWDMIVPEYFRSHPSDSYELNANGAQFPRFLSQWADDPRFGITGFHLELAELEWREWVVYSTLKSIPSPEEIDAPVLNPTLIVMELEYPVVEYVFLWREEQAKGFPDGVPAIPETENPGVVFLFRHPTTHNPVLRRARDPMLFAFKVVHDAIPLEEAVAAAGITVEDGEALLCDAADQGLVILPTENKGRSGMSD